MAEPEKIVVLDGARTPVGSFGGVFKDVPGFESARPPRRRP
jgi:acetyl-CoA C-acetyltransferase